MSDIKAKLRDGFLILAAVAVASFVVIGLLLMTGTARTADRTTLNFNRAGVKVKPPREERTELLNETAQWEGAVEGAYPG